MSQFTKHFKKINGTIAEAIDDTYNILCVKDDPLLKILKLIHSITLDIPIVTDT
ncbi:hypothetical protein DM02DRAFT_620507 [Periconia macrospinosa]|uniref:Uncharacterized protein n=1 Tax=Periconia macrospinosa TaxID=97972 RepID=A0A2V1D2J0_9PLEO|nr:hypothetical protein DM02DRAFT_620507 [Periconia macrospinosa]